MDVLSIAAALGLPWWVWLGCAVFLWQLTRACVYQDLEHGAQRGAVALVHYVSMVASFVTLVFAILGLIRVIPKSM